MATVRTRLTVLVVAAALLLPATRALAIQPMLPTSGQVAAATEPADGGTATARSVPLTVTVGDSVIALADTMLSATNDAAVNATGPLATTALTLADIDGTRFGELAVSSDGTTTSQGAVVDETTLAGPITLIAGQLSATVDDATGTATAALERVDIAVEVLDALGISTAIDGATAVAGPDGATSTHGLEVTGIDVTLGALLGDVLGMLPLEDLLALADQLGVTLPADLDAAQDVVAATDALIAAVADAVAASDAIATAADALVAAEALDPLAGYLAFGNEAAFATLISDLEALDVSGDLAGSVIALTAMLADLTAAGCPVVIPGVPDVTNITALVDGAIACIQAELDGLATATAALLDELTALGDAVTAYSDAVAAALAAAAVLDADSLSLQDVLDAVLDLVADLDGASLLSISGFGIAQEATAIAGDLAGSSASSTCDVTTVSVVLLPPVELDTCDAADSTALLNAVNEAITAITGVLDEVGVIDVDGEVELDILGQVINGVTELSDGRVTALSQVEVLRLGIPAIEVDLCGAADGLVCGLGLDLLEPALDALPDLGTALADAQTVAEDALTTATGVIDALGASIDVVDEVGAGAIVDAAVGVLTGVLDGLDLGELGTAGGTVLPGVGVVIDPQVTATHAAGASVVPAPDPEGGDPLPNTGGGAALLAVLAIAGGWLLRRRKVTEA